uniref:Uncharacterized protein n=1 Tax=Arundo donax TaxID=35708 RepID=A0A0A9C779_ARUDO
MLLIRFLWTWPQQQRQFCSDYCSCNVAPSYCSYGALFTTVGIYG